MGWKTYEENQIFLCQICPNFAPNWGKNCCKWLKIPENHKKNGQIDLKMVNLP